MYALLIVVLEKDKILPLLNFKENFTETVWCNRDTFWDLMKAPLHSKIAKVADTYQVLLVNH